MSKDISKTHYIIDLIGSIYTHEYQYALTVCKSMSELFDVFQALFDDYITFVGMSIIEHMVSLYLVVLLSSILKYHGSNTTLTFISVP